MTSSAARTISVDGLGRQRAELAVDQRGGLLQDPERANHRAREMLVADVEVMERPLGLRAPVAVGGDLDWAHAVGFFALCSILGPRAFGQRPMYQEALNGRACG